MRNQMLQRRLAKLEAVQKEDPPARVIYSWGPSFEDAAEPAAANRPARGGTVEDSGNDPATSAPSWEPKSQDS